MSALETLFRGVCTAYGFVELQGRGFVSQPGIRRAISIYCRLLSVLKFGDYYSSPANQISQSTMQMI